MDKKKEKQMDLFPPSEIQRRDIAKERERVESEKDIKKDFALLDKEKKKDKSQYLPYLFIIFYCSKNKTIEGL